MNWQPKQPAILVVGPSWVGDMVMAQSLFKVLKREQPGVNIDVLTPFWSKGLLKRMPEVRHTISHTIKHGQLVWQERQRIGLELRSYAYQQAIVLPSSWKSALVPFWANIPKRTGYIGEMRYGLLNDIRQLDKAMLRRTVDRFVALGLSKDDPRVGRMVPNPNHLSFQLRALIIKDDPTMGCQVPNPRLLPASVDNTLQRLNLEYPHQPILALCPGAEYGSAKRWPVEYYVSCAKQKIGEGWKVWVLGSYKDVPLGAEIQVLSGNGCTSLCGKTTLSEAVDLLSLVSVVITNDSGLMHVAAALNKPMIALFGSSNPGMTPPLSNQTRTLSLDLKCSPCYQRLCPKRHLKCLRHIRPLTVLKTLNSMIIKGA